MALPAVPEVICALHAGNAAHHIANAGGTGVVNVFLVHHGAGAWEILNAVLQAAAKPTAGYLDTFQLQRIIAGAAFGLLRLCQAGPGQHRQRDGCGARRKGGRSEVLRNANGAMLNWFLCINARTGLETGGATATGRKGRHELCLNLQMITLLIRKWQ